MQIKKSEHFVKTGNIQGSTFGVQLSDKLFSTLYGNLYRYKEAAVVRELFCNARDTHEMRDRLWSIIPSYQQSCLSIPPARFSKHVAPKGTPVEVHLPDDVEPYLEIKDFGTGLSIDSIIGSPITAFEGQVMVAGDIIKESDDDVDPGDIIATTSLYKGQWVFRYVHDNNIVRGKGLYTTLFDSTKTADNGQIGAFGLGSKSPFAVTDSFTVSSRFEGEEHHYIMFLNEDRIPAYDLLTKDLETKDPKPIQTEEYNGLTVRVPVESLKYVLFRDELSRVCRTLEPDQLPTVINAPSYFKLSTIDRQYRLGDTYLQRRAINSRVYDPLEQDYDSDTSDRIHYAVMGGVSYPIDNRMLSEFARKVLSTTETSYTFFQLGELNIPPSREDLSYDDFTKQALLDKMDKLAESIVQDAVFQLKNCPTPFERWILHTKYQKSYGKEFTYFLHNAYDPDPRFSKDCIKKPKLVRPDYNKNEQPWEDLSRDVIQSMFTIDSYGRKNELNSFSPKNIQETKLVLVVLDNTRSYIQKARKLRESKPREKYTTIFISPANKNLCDIADGNFPCNVSMLNRKEIMSEAVSWGGRSKNFDYLQFADQLYSWFDGITEPEILFMSELDYDKASVDTTEHGIQIFKENHHSRSNNYELRPDMSGEVLNSYIEKGLRIVYLPAHGRELDLTDFSEDSKYQGLRVNGYNIHEFVQTLKEMGKTNFSIELPDEFEGSYQDDFSFLYSLGYAPCVVVGKKKALPFIKRYPDIFVSFKDFLEELFSEEGALHLVQQFRSSRQKYEVASRLENRLNMSKYMKWILAQLGEDQSELGNQFIELVDTAPSIKSDYLSMMLKRFPKPFSNVRVMSLASKLSDHMKYLVPSLRDKETRKAITHTNQLESVLSKIVKAYKLPERIYSEENPNKLRLSDKRDVRVSIETWRIMKHIAQTYQFSMVPMIWDENTFKELVLKKNMGLPYETTKVKK